MFARLLRKHRTALIALAVYHFVLFFPVAFLGRVVSPNDIYYNYQPWASVKPEGIFYAQNSSLNDVATAYLTLMSMMREGLDTFHWNPFIGSGIPGYGSSASAVLSPFILLPALLVPLVWVYTAILFLKLNAAFFFAYLWLREERLGKRGAAVGAMVAAGAGIYAVRWLWQSTNATVLYPALLFFVARMLNGKRNSIALMTLVALAIGLSGFPAATAYGAWIVVFYLITGAIMRRSKLNARAVGKNLLAAIAAAAIALMIAAPSLVPFAQFLQRSGYLEIRESTSGGGVFPPAHWRNFIDPERLGNPALKSWVGDPQLGSLNAYSEATVYLGLLTLPLALIGIFSWRAKRRVFWMAAAALLLALMFGAPGISPIAASLPGVKFSALARLSLLLPLAAAYLAGAGAKLLRWRWLVTGVAIVLAFDLALLAGRFYPYLEPEDARVPTTPVIEFLRDQPQPFRIAPFFDYLWPNTAELARVEDVRSHFGSEALYRRMLTRVDPSAWNGRSTLLTLNSLQFNFSDPLTNLLGIRYYIEHNAIDIIKWKIFESSRPGVGEEGPLPFEAGEVLERTIPIAEAPFHAIEIPVAIRKLTGIEPHLEVTLFRGGRAMWSRRFTKEDADVMNKIYVPVQPPGAPGETLRLRLRANGVSGSVTRGANAVASETPLYFARVMIPLIFERQLPDGRLFRNLAELPRFRVATEVRKLNDEEFLAARDIDFTTTTVITDDPVMPPAISGNGTLRLASYAPARQQLFTDSETPIFIASSEKLTPELRVTIDGEIVPPVEVDLLFAGVEVPAGRHEVVFSRRLARGWWWIAALGVLLFGATAVWETMRRRRRSTHV